MGRLFGRPLVLRRPGFGLDADADVNEPGSSDFSRVAGTVPGELGGAARLRRGRPRPAGPPRDGGAL